MAKTLILPAGSVLVPNLPRTSLSIGRFTLSRTDLITPL
jgi:hypothetical protein